MAPQVQIFFQTRPGGGSGKGISGVPWEVCVDGTRRENGTTGADGATSPFYVPSNSEVILHALGTNYRVTFHPELASSYTDLGFVQRLAMLGYYRGDTGSSAHSFSVEHALMCAEADEARTPNGFISVRDSVHPSAERDGARNFIIQLVAASPGERRRARCPPDHPEEISSDPIPLHVYRGVRRVCPLFVEGPRGQPPSSEFPVIDDRGFEGSFVLSESSTAPVQGAVLPVPQDGQVRVHLSRRLIADSAQLFVRAPQGGVLFGGNPLSGQGSETHDLTATAGEDITVQGERGRFGIYPIDVCLRREGGDPLVVHTFTAAILTPIHVRLAFYRVLIHGPAGSPTPDTMQIGYAEILRIAQAIWAQYNVNLDLVGSTTELSLTLEQTNFLSQVSHIEQLFSMHIDNSTLPVFFVYGIDIPGGELNGFGIPFANHLLRTPGPRAIANLRAGVVLSHQMGRGASAFHRRLGAALSWGIDLGHELGHAFGLGHPGDRDAHIEDLWSKRRLMYYGTTIQTVNDLRWHATVGSGDSLRGTLLTMKQRPGDSRFTDLYVARAVADLLQSAQRRAAQPAAAPPPPRP